MRFSDWINKLISCFIESEYVQSRERLIKNGSKNVEK